ncbi:hypothetical protein D9M71_721040 [compost metagenome]
MWGSRISLPLRLYRMPLTRQRWPPSLGWAKAFSQSILDGSTLSIGWASIGFCRPRALVAGAHASSGVRT